MTQKEKRQVTVNSIAVMLMNNPFKFEFKVVKKPKGIKVIYEVTQEEMDCIMNMTMDGCVGK